MPGYLSEKGLRVLINGFDVIPVLPGQKAPSVKGWETVETTKDQLNSWISNGRANHGLGIPTKRTPFIDIDAFDVPCQRYMRDFIETNVAFAPVRIGNPPKRGYLFRAGEPFRKLSSKIYIDPENRKAQIEILGDGQQFVAFHTHPDTKKPYRWLFKESPETVKADDLPELTQEAGRRIVKAFEDWCEAQGWRRGSSKGLPVPVERPGFLDPDDIDGDYGGLCGLTDDEIREKLMAIPNDDRFDAREDWLKIGFAVHHETGGSGFGYDLWLEWSEQHPSHDQALFDKAWNSFGKRDDPRVRGVTFRFVIKIAGEYEKKAKDEEIVELLQRMDFAHSLDELRAIATDCRKIETDLLDRSRLITAMQKAAKTIGVPLGIREAREMIRYRPMEGETPDWLDGWVYLKHAERFYHRPTGERLKREAFDATFGRFVGSEAVASKYALDTIKIPTYHMTIYLPGEDDIFCDPTGLEWINTYNPKHQPPIPDTLTKRDRENVEIVKNHARHLFDDQRGASIFMSWLAYIVQTNKRPNWAVIIQGAEGTGKTFYLQLMAAVLGGPNVFSLDADTLLRSNFTSWAEGYLLVGIEEVKQFGHNRHDVPNRMKIFITNPTVTVHPKNINPYNVPNTAAYLMFTNFRDALPLTANDSRYFVLMSRWQRKADIDAFKAKNPDYYRRLFKAIQESPGAIRKWFLEYELHPDFNPQERAPISAGKTRMIAESKSEEQQIIEELVAEKRHPLVSDDLIVVHILRELTADDTGEVSGRMASSVGVRHMLTDLGYMAANRIRIGEQRYSIWTTNHVWAEASVETLKKLISDRLNEAAPL